MSRHDPLAPCASPSFDPEHIAGHVPEGFCPWFQRTDRFTAAPGRDAQGRPTPEQIDEDPETWLRSLRAHLQMGLQVELFTLPPYLTAMWSLQEGHNDIARSTLREVLMEEMLHMTLVANVLSAVGGRPVLNSPTALPAYPSRIPFSGLDLVVPLAPFSQQTICGLRAVETPAELAPRNPTWNEDLGFTSIGEFYSVALDMLWTLTLVLGPTKVFTGEAERQVRPEHYYGGGGQVVEVPRPTRDPELGSFVPLNQAGSRQRDVFWRCPTLRHAFRALTTVINQGEGTGVQVRDRKALIEGPSEPPSAALEATDAGPILLIDEGTGPAGLHLEGASQDLPISDGDTTFGQAFDVAHFYKFDEILKERLYVQGDQGLQPTGDRFEVDWEAVWPMQPNPDPCQHRDHTELHAAMVSFARAFTELLEELQRALNGEQQRLRTAVGQMYSLKYQGQALMRTPLGDGSGQTAGAPFVVWRDQDPG